ncbi:hypothetical protein PENSPDRAFT_45708 [Peniophora sp. CONT]|nr:hypothetical protein PENSPDRAFT_45708 [Peniophora sp. CONT]
MAETKAQGYLRLRPTQLGIAWIRRLCGLLESRKYVVVEEKALRANVDLNVAGKDFRTGSTRDQAAPRDTERYRALPLLPTTMSDAKEGHEIRIPGSDPSQAGKDDDTELQLEAQTYISCISACAYAPLCPISRIPPEILLTIFKLVATVDPPHCRYTEVVRRNRYYDQKPSSLGWVRVSHLNVDGGTFA